MVCFELPGLCTCLPSPLRRLVDKFRRRWSLGRTVVLMCNAFCMVFGSFLVGRRSFTNPTLEAVGRANNVVRDSRISQSAPTRQYQAHPHHP